MLISKIVSGFYNSAKTIIIKSYYFVKNSPHFYKVQMFNIIEYLRDFKYKLRNLGPVNTELGIYHLQKNNLQDAIIRFKLVEKFFIPNDPKAFYLLGWSYFLKNHNDQAITYLDKASEADECGLGNFIRNSVDCEAIDNNIWQTYRDFVAEYYHNSFITKEINVPRNLAQMALLKISKDLPDNYNILDLGANVGLLGYEIQSRFPDNFTLIGVEPSERMVELAEVANNALYDRLVNQDITKFLNNCADKFDIILSLNGFSFAKDLKKSLSLIHSLLQTKGALAFSVMPSDGATALSLQHKEFIFNKVELTNTLDEIGFSDISYNELALGAGNKYLLVSCKK